MNALEHMVEIQAANKKLQKQKKKQQPQPKSPEILPETESPVKPTESPKKKSPEKKKSPTSVAQKSPAKKTGGEKQGDVAEIKQNKKAEKLQKNKEKLHMRKAKAPLEVTLCILEMEAEDVILYRSKASDWKSDKTMREFILKLRAEILANGEQE